MKIIININISAHSVGFKLAYSIRQCDNKLWKDEQIRKRSGETKIILENLSPVTN